MKGGAFRRWYGNQEYVINYGQNGYEIKAWADPLYGNSGWSRIIKSTEYYFRPVVTWSAFSARGISARAMPVGFIIGHKGPAVFLNTSQNLMSAILATLNSKLASILLAITSPTIMFEVGQLAKLPVPGQFSPQIMSLVGQAVELARHDSSEDETTYGFIAPPTWKAGIEDVAARHRRLSEIELQIDEKVFRLYGISDEDPRAIEAELVEPATNDASDEESDDLGSNTEDAEVPAEAPLTREDLARRWISYAVGIVMGRFQPGINGALGRGNFSEDIAAKLRALADSDGILILDQGHEDDLATKVLQALRIMLGDEAAAEVIVEGIGQAGNQENELRRYFERSFFKELIGKQKYRKRPVYWLLQSPGKTYSVWLFHEKLTKDTLYRIRGDQYVAWKIRLLESHIADLRRQREASQGRERRALEKQVAEIDDVLDDLRAFAERIDTILQRGYTPHIDDGVLINMAPLWELMPSWQAEPKKCWDALARGDYDWSHQAMDHWPERVRKKCQTNKSYAIAHGLA